MKRTLLLPLLALLCAALLGGCASTAYKDGYATRFQIGPNKWIAYYEGTADMSEAMVMDYAINHCASVALDLGYSYYRIQEIQRGGTSSNRIIPGMTRLQPVATSGGGTLVVETRTPDRLVTLSRESFSITFEGFHEQTEGALNARQVWDAFLASQQKNAR